MFRVIDLRTALFEAKKEKQVYFKMDSHWNHYAANVAQFEILQVIEKLFPEDVSPVLLSDIAKIESITEIEPKPLFNNTCKPRNLMKGAREQDTFTVQCKDVGLNAVIFGDSFFRTLRPYFERQFHRSTYIFEMMNYSSLQKYVAEERPAIVIEEVVERMLPYVPESP